MLASVGATQVSSDRGQFERSRATQVSPLQKHTTEENMNRQQRPQTNHRTLAVLLASIAGIGATTAARAADTVFVDHFKNGSVTDSDATANFWTPRNSGGQSNAAETVGGPLQLTAGGSQY